MFNAFLLTNSIVKSLGRSLYRLLERREVVSVTSRMMDFGKQNKGLLRGFIKSIGLGHLKLNQ